jgi:uncharacterized protein (DUF1697 family)
MRAVNVAGHARIGMTAVREAFADAGFRNVRTYIQSGNVLFESSRAETATMLQSVHVKLRLVCGEEPRLMLRTARELGGAVEKAPFTARHLASGAKLYVVFLARRPRTIPAFPLSLPKERLEALGMTNREVFVVSHRKESGFFGFPNSFVEDRLGVPATSRNWSTVVKVLDRLGEPPGERAAPE